MPTLPITALKCDTIYWCALSGQMVLVVNITELAGQRKAFIRYFNHSTGKYEEAQARDNQLIPATNNDQPFHRHEHLHRLQLEEPARR